jgi:hypothetical protein
MNADVTERMGATEQAMADAERLDDRNPRSAWIDERRSGGRRRFARAFLGASRPDQANTLVGADGGSRAAGRPLGSKRP